jgi:hypothetical protein
VTPLNDAALACAAYPDDCPNGPEPHEFVPDSGRHVAADDLVWPCCRQTWEDS